MLKKWKSHKTQESEKYKLDFVSILSAVGELMRRMLGVGMDASFLQVWEGQWSHLEGLVLTTMNLWEVVPRTSGFCSWMGVERNKITSHLCFTTGLSIAFQRTTILCVTPFLLSLSCFCVRDFVSLITFSSFSISSLSPFHPFPLFSSFCLSLIL